MSSRRCSRLDAGRRWQRTTADRDALRRRRRHPSCRRVEAERSTALCAGELIGEIACGMGRTQSMGKNEQVTLPGDPIASRPAPERARPTRSDGSSLRILIVDDEAPLADALGHAFRIDGWDVRVSYRGREVLAAARQWRPDVVILDIMMPDIDGITVMRRLHEIHPESRVMLLTARDGVRDRIDGLTAGGDDYVTKPFGVREVVARAHRLALTSVHADPDPSARRLALGRLELDESEHVVRSGSVPVDLGVSEFDVLRVLLCEAQRAVTKRELLTRVWGLKADPSSNLVKMTISRLRRKIGEDSGCAIQTIRGIGYILKLAD
jgi:two-component system OmpR family response regulator